MRRKLKLLDLTLIGIGLIIGAGVYALIGESALLAGKGLPWSLVVAGLAAACSALSLAELASIYPLDASVYEYCKRAFGSEMIGFLCAWALIFSAITLASTVSIGFGQYLNRVTQLPAVSGAIAVLLLVVVINGFGVELTSFTNALIVVLETLGLLIIIYIGLTYTGELKGAEMGLSGIMAGAALAFFAYTGFEAIITAAEETENPRSTIPKAIILSLGVCTVLYILVGIAVLKVGTPEQLRSAPLAVVAEIVSGPVVASIISLIAFLSLSNTVLLSIYEGSRLIYGMAEEKVLPRLFKNMNKYEVPQNAILVVGLFSIILSFTGIVFAAEVTNFLLLFVLLLCNIAVISLRQKSPHLGKGFKVPTWKGFPITAPLGIISCIALIIFIKPWEIAISLAIIAFGALVYYIRKLLK